MNVIGNPVIYYLESSVQFFLPDQIAHFLEKEAKIFQRTDYQESSFFPKGSMKLSEKDTDHQNHVFLFFLLIPFHCFSQTLGCAYYNTNEKVLEEIKNFLIRF